MKILGNISTKLFFVMKLKASVGKFPEGNCWVYLKLVKEVFSINILILSNISVVWWFVHAIQICWTFKKIHILWTFFPLKSFLLLVLDLTQQATSGHYWWFSLKPFNLSCLYVRELILYRNAKTLLWFTMSSKLSFRDTIVVSSITLKKFTLNDFLLSKFTITYPSWSSLS